MDKNDKARIYKRLTKVGLWKLAKLIQTYYIREARKRKNKADESAAKHDRVTADLAYYDAWIQLEPLCKILEDLTKKANAPPPLPPEPLPAPPPPPPEPPPPPPPEPVFTGFTGDPTTIIDQDYKQEDAGLRLRDAFVWVGDEFRAIVEDTPEGTTMHFDRASNPPPTGLAVMIAEEYAQADPGRRRDLFARLQQFATKNSPKTDAPDDDYAGDN